MQKSFKNELVTTMPEKNEKEKELLALEDSCNLKNKYFGKLQEDEKTLTARLEELKKENFSLQVSIKAWQATLKKKLEEFKQTELKLDELHSKIWSAREEFCERTDKFCDENGILSDWWNEQMAYVTELENLGLKRIEEKKTQNEIMKLQQEIDCLKKELEELKKGERIKETTIAEIHLPPYTEIIGDGNENNFHGKFEPRKKHISFAIEDEELIEVSPEKCTSPPANDLFALMDVDRLKMACKRIPRK